MQKVDDLNDKQKEALHQLADDLDKVEHKHHYPTDKNGWVHYKNKSIKKVKLRAFIAKRAKDLRFLDAYPSQLKAREVLIEKYNEGGVNLVDNFVNSEFLKEVQITFDEMKELEKNA